jgi:predicted PurR-regulated permease PerM
VTEPDAQAPASNARLARLATIALLVFVSYRLFQPILPALLWGSLLAIISAHTYERVVSRLGGRRGLGAAAMGLVYLVTLIVPLLFLISELTGLATLLSDLTEQLSSGKLLERIEGAEQSVGQNTRFGEWITIAADNFDEILSQIAPHLGTAATWLLARFGEFGGFLLEFLLGCATSLFFLYHRFVIRSLISRFLRGIGGPFAVDLMQQTFDTTRDTFHGVIAAALAQATLSAGALLVAEVPGVFVLTVLAFLLALVQIGPFVTGVIAAVTLFGQGDTLAAVLILLWFLVVVSSVDNLVRPFFAARANDTPGYLAFLGALGGVLSFGLIGVVIGPVIVTLVFRLGQAWFQSRPAVGPPSSA